jgi:hypothetical protein
MGDQAAKRIETGVELAAAGLFGASAGFAALNLLPPPLAFAAGALALLLARLAISRVGSAPRSFQLPPFELEPEIRAQDKNELLLTSADEWKPEAVGQPLLLDDILAEIGPDARVVRIFDRSAMPTPAELKHRVDHHLAEARVPSKTPDASRALYAALEELRASLR